MGNVTCMLSHKIDDLVFNEFLPEMFKRVGLKASDINDLTKQPSWFSAKTWTVQDEEEFVKWLVCRLKLKFKMTSSLAEKEARMFVLNYGWSTGAEKQLDLNL